MAQRADVIGSALSGDPGALVHMSGLSEEADAQQREQWVACLKGMVREQHEVHVLNAKRWEVRAAFAEMLTVMILADPTRCVHEGGGACFQSNCSYGV